MNEPEKLPPPRGVRIREDNIETDITKTPGYDVAKALFEIFSTKIQDVKKPTSEK